MSSRTEGGKREGSAPDCADWSGCAGVSTAGGSPRKRIGGRCGCCAGAGGDQCCGSGAEHLGRVVSNRCRGCPWRCDPRGAGGHRPGYDRRSFRSRSIGVTAEAATDAAVTCPAVPAGAQAVPRLDPVRCPSRRLSMVTLPVLSGRAPRCAGFTGVGRRRSGLRSGQHHVRCGVLRRRGNDRSADRGVPRAAGRRLCGAVVSEEPAVDMADQPADAYCAAVTGGTGLDAAAVIVRVSVACGVNPRVMLVTLQKESGLLDRTDPTARPMRRRGGGIARTPARVAPRTATPHMRACEPGVRDGQAMVAVPGVAGRYRYRAGRNRQHPVECGRSRAAAERQ